MAMVGELVFIFLADYMKHGASTLHVYFVVSYLVVAVFQVSTAERARRLQCVREKVKGSSGREWGGSKTFFFFCILR